HQRGPCRDFYRTEGTLTPGTQDRVGVDVNELIKNAGTISRNRWKDYADVRYEFDESIGTAFLFPAEINQVLLNMIVNAADAIAEKGDEGNRGTITIRTAQKNSDLLLEIEDTGCGMSDEVRRRIFEPFFTTKDVGKGTGQGLAITYDAIARRHGGTIEVSSAVGLGTTFRIRLPQSLSSVDGESCGQEAVVADGA
ncbi:MAG: hypothetical protein KF847_17855, partial [Pirellulales bacterium]|nr:hypothetical protein [Pirellulales bacterium]